MTSFWPILPVAETPPRRSLSESHGQPDTYTHPEHFSHPRWMHVVYIYKYMYVRSSAYYVHSACYYGAQVSSQGSRKLSMQSFVQALGQGSIRGSGFTHRKRMVLVLNRGCPEDVKHKPGVVMSSTLLAGTDVPSQTIGRSMWEAPCFVYMLACASPESASVDVCLRIFDIRRLSAGTCMAVARQQQAGLCVQQFEDLSQAETQTRSSAIVIRSTSARRNQGRETQYRAQLCQAMIKFYLDSRINVRMPGLGRRGPLPEMIASPRRFPSHMRKSARWLSSHLATGEAANQDGSNLTHTNRYKSKIYTKREQNRKARVMCSMEFSSSLCVHDRPLCRLNVWFVPCVR